MSARQPGHPLPRISRLITLLALLSTLTAAGLWGYRAAERFFFGSSVGSAASGVPSIPQMTVQELLEGKATDWRVAWLHENPAILVIEFPGLVQQGQAMNRIAAFLEKSAAPRERVLDDAELHQLIFRGSDSASTFYLGHDYDASGLTRFFEQARQQGVKLNSGELRLQRILREAGILPAPGEPLPVLGIRALVSFSSTQADDPETEEDELIDPLRRAAVLRHELSHGEFFTNAAYREHCRRFWRERLSEQERQLMRRYLVELGYDSSNEELLANETQALLMHTPDSRDFNALGLGISEAALEGMRRKFDPQGRFDMLRR